MSDQVRNQNVGFLTTRSNVHNHVDNVCCYIFKIFQQNVNNFLNITSNNFIADVYNENTTVLVQIQKVSPVCVRGLSDQPDPTVGFIFSSSVWLQIIFSPVNLNLKIIFTKRCPQRWNFFSPKVPISSYNDE